MRARGPRADDGICRSNELLCLIVLLGSYSSATVIFAPRVGWPLALLLGLAGPLAIGLLFTLIGVTLTLVDRARGE